MIFTSYATPFSRVPEYNEGIFLFPFFLLLLWQGVTFLLKNRIYHFQLHSDVLIITSRTAFSKKRDFFHIEQINSILIEKEQKYKAESSSIFDYAITVLNIKSTNKDSIRYTFSPSYHELSTRSKVIALKMTTFLASLR